MPIQRWRCPVVVTVKCAVFAAVEIVLVTVFFPFWLAVPVMVVIGAWALGLCVRRAEVRVDADAGLAVFRMGLITRRIQLGRVTAVQVDQAKVSLARSDGAEISVYAWQKSRLDRWLRAPVVAGDVAHAISRAAVAAREAQPVGAAAGPAAARPRVRWSRRRLAPALLGGIGLAALAAAFLVRVSWPSPVMTVIGALLALALGVAGVCYVLISVWLLLTSRDQGLKRRGLAGMRR